MEEALIKRVMPHSVEAEQSVVGAMLMDKDAITTASEIISGQDFYQTSYGVVFDSMVELFNEGKPVDLVTLQERLKEKDVPPEISSLEFVRDLVNAVPTSANVKYYAEIVADKAMMRKLIKLTESIANTCYVGKESLPVIMEQTEKSVFELLQHRNTGDYVPIKDVVLNALERIEKASKNKGTVTGIPTGFIDLDYKLSGLQPSDLVLVAARPSMGTDAIQVATRFVTTEECDADIRYKEAYLNAGKEDIVIVKSPVGMPGRAILNPFMKKVKEQGRIAPAHCYRCLKH